MNQSQRDLLSCFTDQIPDAYLSFYNDLIEYSLSLGYRPVKKTASFNLDFKKIRLKQTILKLECPPVDSAHPLLRMKFYSSHLYNSIFKDSL